MRRTIGDHPDIARVLRDGVDDGWHDGWKRHCPVCGAELDVSDTVYMNWREVIGCEHCIEAKNASEVWEDEDD